MKTLTKFLLPACLTLPLIACGGDKGSEDDNSSSAESQAGVSAASGTTAQTPNSTVQLSVQGSLPASNMQLLATNVEVTDPDGSIVGTFEISDARLVLDKIELKQAEVESEESLSLQEDEAEEESQAEEDSTSDEESDSAEEQKFKGPFLVDLLTNVMTPEPEAVVIPEGLYKSVKLSVHKTEDGDAEVLGMAASDPLYGNSVYVAGLYTPTGGTSVPFAMSFDLSEEFEIRNKSGFAISQQSVNEFLIAFRLAEWFRFDNPETNGDGLSMTDIGDAEIILNKDSEGAAKELREMVKENIKLSAEAGKDEDGDGELGHDEDGDDQDDEEDEEEENESAE